MTGWIYISGQVVGSQLTGFRVAWGSDLRCKPTVKSAIAHGFREVGSDDFRLGYVQRGILKRLQWMEDPPKYFDEIEQTAEQLGLRAAK